MKRIGKCDRCGDCCRVIEFRGSLFKEKLKRRLIRPFKSDLPTFEETAKFLNNHKNIRVIIDDKFYRIIIKAPCKYLIEKKNGTTSCKIYKKRPKICKKFPQTPKDTKFMLKCGYNFAISDELD